MKTHIGRVTKIAYNGIWVEVAMGGQYVQYGPMEYVSPTGAAIVFEPGERVLIGAYGRIRDTFIILGKVMSVITPAPTESTA